MAGDKKEVELEFTADTSKLKKAMREAKQLTGEMQGSSQKMNKATLKGTKDIAKISKKTSKLKEKTSGRKAIQDEKKLQRAKRQTTTEVLKQSKAYESIQKDAGKLQRDISKVTSKTRDMNRELRRSKSLFGGLGGGGGGRGGGGSGGGGSRRGGVSSFLGGFLKKSALGLGKLAMGGALGLGGTLMGIITSQLTGGYQERMAYGKAYGGLAGTGGKLSTLQGLRGTKSQILNQHEYSQLERLGFSPQEMAQQAAPVARATGKVGSIKTALEMQRATTMGGGEVAQFMGLLTQAGVGFGGAGGKGGKKELEKVIKAGIVSGLERARLPEFVSGVSALTQRMAASTAGKVNVSDYSGLLATMGASGQPGLQGARGAAVAQALDRGVRQPGGGEAGKAFMLQAMGFGKPGGGASYYEAVQASERGATKNNIGKIITEAQRQFGGKQERALAMKKLLGIDTRVWEGLEKAWKEQDKEKIDELLKDTKSIDEQALAEMKEFGDVTKHMSELQNRSIGIGESIEDSVKKLEEVINKFVIKALPLAVKALEKIATIVEDIYIWLIGSDLEGKAKEKFQESSKEYRQLRKQLKEGSITPEEARKRFAEIRKTSKKFHGGMFENVGMIEKVGEGWESFVTQTGRSLGIDLSGIGGAEKGKPTDVQKRAEWQAKHRRMRMKSRDAEEEMQKRVMKKNPQHEIFQAGGGTVPYEQWQGMSKEERSELVEVLKKNADAAEKSANATEEIARQRRTGPPAATAQPTTTGN